MLHKLNHNYSRLAARRRCKLVCPLAKPGQHSVLMAAILMGCEGVSTSALHK